MKGLFVLRFPSGKAKGLFYMMYGAFYGCPYLIRGRPIQGARGACRKSAQFLLRIGIDHPYAGGIREESSHWHCRWYFLDLGFFTHFILGYGNSYLTTPLRSLLVPSGFMEREGSWGQQGIP